MVLLSVLNIYTYVGADHIFVSNLNFNFLGCSEKMNMFWVLRICRFFGGHHKIGLPKVSKSSKIRNRYNQAPHLTQDTNGKVTNSQIYTTNESQGVSPFPAGDHKAQLNRRTHMHNKHKTEKKHKGSTKEVPPWYPL